MHSCNIPLALTLTAIDIRSHTQKGKQNVKEHFTSLH